MLSRAGIYVQVGIDATLSVDDVQSRKVGKLNIVRIFVIRRQQPSIICPDELKDIVVSP